MSDDIHSNDKTPEVDSITKDPLLDHDYDGIKELDNPLPRWWLFTFYITIVFSAIYVAYFHFTGALSPLESYVEEIAVITEKAQKARAAQTASA